MMTSDRALGEVYPERGLMFAYADGSTDPQEARVEHVILETITVEPFLLRAQQEPADHYARRLADLEVAQRLAPEDPVAFGLAARIDIECGRPLTALAAAQKAVELNPESIEYQIALADAKRQLGQTREALELTRTVLQRSDLTPLDQARARFILGRILATTAPRNYRQAMEETVTAIKVAAAQIGGTERQTSDPDPTGTDRRGTVARGNPGLRSLEAEAPGDPAVAGHGGEGGQRVHRERTAARAVCCSASTARRCTACWCWTAQGRRTTLPRPRSSSGATSSPRPKMTTTAQCVEWQLGTGLWYAAQVAYRQGHASAALQYANNADALLASAGKTRVRVARRRRTIWRNCSS